MQKFYSMVKGSRPDFYPYVSFFKLKSAMKYFFCFSLKSYLNFLYSEKGTKFCEIYTLLLSTVCSMQYIETKVRWRFRKILWPSQNTWPLSGTNSVKLLSVDSLEFWNAEKIKSAFLSLYDLVFSLELKFRNINGFQFFTYFWNRIRIFKGGWISISILSWLQKSNFLTFPACFYIPIFFWGAWIRLI